MINLFFFQWPSDLGGADTRLKDLIQGFNNSKKYNLYCIPNDNGRLLEKHNTDFLDQNNVRYLSWEALPNKLEGYAISFCNFRLFSEKWRIEKIKSIGLKFIWSNDMMWRTPEENQCIEQNLVDAVIYTSEKHYKDTSTIQTKQIKEAIIPNYFYPDNYQYIDRKQKNFISIGKHSRPDMLKFSDNFPLFYESLPLNNPKYRVMGINSKFKERFKWFEFSNRWDLLRSNQETIIDYLSSLDVYVYNSHYSFTETQCRATIEAMLTGLPVVAPTKDNFLNQIWHTKSGFLFNTDEECRYFVKILEKDFILRKNIGKLARTISLDLWCDTNKQIETWEKLFNIL
jgi:glycosyltransferase involved in cell wall biosynthesis